MLLALCLTTVSCEDTDALKSDINSLNDRVTALESKVKMLNDNIASLHILLQNGIIITTVENADGVYTLTLSDGTVLKLAEKTAGFANTPLVSIDAEGNWQVSYDNGQTFQPMLQGDNKVPAIVDDGVTPKFRVSLDGFWEISYDGGTIYERVKDEAGNDVKAVYDAGTSDSQAFVGAAVSADGSSLELTLADGTTKVSVPIVPDFFCYFDEAITGEQKINKGETKTFNLHIKGADQTIVTAPTGWKAVLGDADATTNIAVLTVTAPGASAAAASTKATADNTRDISVLAMKGGFATIAKLQVNPIDVTIGGGDEGGNEGEGGDEGEGEGGGTDEPVTSLALSITSSTQFTDMPNWSLSNKLSGNTDFWFHREHTNNTTTTVVTIADDGGTSVIQAVRTTLATVGWNNSSFGYHSTATFEQAQYKLSFKAKSNVASSTVGVAIRTASDAAGFRMIKNTGDNWERNVTTPAAESSWTDISVIFDFSYASTAMSSTASKYTAEEFATTADDVKGINIYLYNNVDNTTIQVKDIKLEKM